MSANSNLELASYNHGINAVASKEAADDAAKQFRELFKSGELDPNTAEATTALLAVVVPLLDSIAASNIAILSRLSIDEGEDETTS